MSNARFTVPVCAACAVGLAAAFAVEGQLPERVSGVRGEAAQVAVCEPASRALRGGSASRRPGGPGPSIAPHRDARGAVDGYRLDGVDPGSPLGLLGIADGDVLHRIDGRAVTHLGGLIGASVDAAEPVRLDFTRAGEPLRVNARMRDLW